MAASMICLGEDAKTEYEMFVDLDSVASYLSFRTWMLTETALDDIKGLIYHSPVARRVS